MSLVSKKQMDEAKARPWPEGLANWPQSTRVRCPACLARVGQQCVPTVTYISGQEIIETICVERMRLCVITPI
jgi:hypothetical protein